MNPEIDTRPAIETARTVTEVGAKVIGNIMIAILTGEYPKDEDSEEKNAQTIIYIMSPQEEKKLSDVRKKIQQINAPTLATTPPAASPIAPGQA